MTTQTNLADVPAVAEIAATPAARKSLGWMSVGYFPKERARHADGLPFTAHDFAIRYSFKNKEGQIEHRDLTIPRRQALNLVECLRDVYVQSYDVSPPSEDE